MQLNNAYKDLILTHTGHKLIVIGHSPYWEGAAGIPFMKKCWSQMLSPTCAGEHVIQSLTGKWIHDTCALWSKRLKRNTPLHYAIDCLYKQLGIVLLNATYTYVSRGKRTETEYLQELRERIDVDWSVNRPILERLFLDDSPIILLCGKQCHYLEKRIRELWVATKQLDENTDLSARIWRVMHPDARNTTSHAKFRRWAELWAPGRLKEVLRTDNPRNPHADMYPYGGD